MHVDNRAVFPFRLRRCRVVLARSTTESARFLARALITLCSPVEAVQSRLAIGNFPIVENKGGTVPTRLWP
jgi:hypothetical protein